MKSNIIPLAQAVEMKREYKNTISPLIETSKSTVDEKYSATEFMFIDLQTLKDYIKKLEEIENINNKVISGIRIYFSAYPNAYIIHTSGEKPKYKGRESIFLAPTIEVQSTSEVSKAHPALCHLPFCINPEDKSNNEFYGPFEIIEDLLYKHDEKPTNTTNSLNNKTSLILNDINLTPPPK